MHNGINLFLTVIPKLKKMKLSYYLFAVILCLSASDLYAQRCGGHIKFNISDKSKEIIYPIIKDRTLLSEYYENKNCESTISGLKVYTIMPENLIDNCIGIYSENANQFYYELKTGCGMRLWRFEIVLNNKRMLIDVQNIKMEAEYVFDAIPFQEGEYVLDLNPINEDVYVNPETIVQVEKYLHKKN